LGRYYSAGYPHNQAEQWFAPGSMLVGVGHEGPPQTNGSLGLVEFLRIDQCVHNGSCRVLGRYVQRLVALAGLAPLAERQQFKPSDRTPAR